MQAWLVALDTWALRLTIGAVGAVPGLDSLLGAVLDANLVKIAVPLALLWVLWFADAGRISGRMDLALCSLAGLVGAVALGRAAQLLLPFRPRPLFDPQVQGLLPSPELARQFDGWSAFPSDHGTLVGALIAAGFAASMPAGLVLAGWTLPLVLLPRVHYGLHWPSDVLAGLAMGAGITLAALRAGLPARARGPVERLAASHPGLLLALMFLASYEVANLFQDSRSLARSLARALGAG